MTEIPTTAGIYTLNDLKNAWSEGKRFKFVYFWKPDDSKDVQTTACFSQWQPSTFTVNSDVYFCAEQFMMASKARLFPNNKPILNEIMKTFDPKRMKSLGRKVQNFDSKVWDAKCQEIVFQGNVAKFSQNENMKKVLMSFDKNTIFVEASPFDHIWGIKLDENDSKAADPFQWRGTNYLGFTLTRVRDSFL